MEKIKNHIFSIIFLCVLILNYFNFITNKENINTNTVFYSEETNKLYYDYYYISFSNLNTKNFEEIIDKFEYKDYKIIKLYTTPNSEYNDKLIEKLKEYNYESIEKFVKYYINNLDTYKLYEEINNVNVYGIKIDKILIYTNEDNIKKLKSELNDITYKNKED